MVDLRCIALRSAERRRLPPAMASASKVASTILTLLMAVTGSRITGAFTMSVDDSATISVRSLSTFGESWGVRGLPNYRETLTPHPIPLPMGEGADRACCSLSTNSSPHEPFDFALSPGQRLFERLALHEPHHPLGLDRLGINLHRDLRRRGLGRDRENLVIVRIGIVIERALGRCLFGPHLERRQLLERRQVVAGARIHHLLDRRRLREVHEQTFGRRFVLAEAPDAVE